MHILLSKEPQSKIIPLSLQINCIKLDKMKSFICTLLMIALVAFASVAQERDIVKDINNSGVVSITLPSGLVERNNGTVGKTQQVKTDADESTPRQENKTIDSPRRGNTSQQTVQGRKVGFRIQVCNDNSPNGKANAQARARAISMKYPQYRTYITYNTPAWRLRIGDFKDQSEANAALARVRSSFPAFSGEMFLVKDNINVWSR